MKNKAREHMHELTKAGLLAVWLVAGLGCVEATSADYAGSRQNAEVDGSDEGGSDTLAEDTSLGSDSEETPIDTGSGDEPGDSGSEDSADDPETAIDTDTPSSKDSEPGSTIDTEATATEPSDTDDTDDTVDTVDTGEPGEDTEEPPSDTQVDTTSAQDTETGSSGGGVELGGAYWYYAADVNVSCETVCASHGGYDEATGSFAGSGGTNEDCGAVLDAVGAPATVTDVSNTVPGSVGIGCAFMPNLIMRVRDKAATTADAVNVWARRVCACKE